jgi:hypothetical protein
MGEQTDDDDDYVSLTRARPVKRRPSAVKRDMAREEKLEALERQEKEEEKSQPQPQTQPTQHLAPPSGVRNRLPKPQQTAKPPAAASGTFTSVPPPSYQSDNPDAILDMQRSEQEVIEKDLLSMAKMLRESTMEFSRHLEDEKDILAKAKEGLDKNVAGMQSTGSKMDNLRKNETVSWYWGIIYMAIIVALVSHPREREKEEDLANEWENRSSWYYWCCFLRRS